MLYAREMAMKALIALSKLTSKFTIGLLSYSMNPCDCCLLVIHALFLFVENIIGSLFPFLFSPSFLSSNVALQINMPAHHAL